MDESLSEEQLAAVKAGQDSSSGSMRELLTSYWKPLLLCFLITMGGTLAFYAYSVNAPAIVKATYKDQAMTATWINLIGLIFLMALQPVGGLISDKVGRKPLLLFFGFGGVVYTYVLFTYLPQTRSPIMSFVLVAVSYVLLTGYTSINALVKSELFPAHVRALGVGVGYALANSIFGGTAPVIYQALKEKHQVPLFIAYVTLCIAISLVVYLFFLKNKADTYLDREKGSAFGTAESMR
jgi:MHS family alpha-ketoglutarate permease-like MFS transporter